MDQEYPYPRPGAGGGGLAAGRADIASKSRIWTYLGGIFAVPVTCAQFLQGREFVIPALKIE